MWPPVIFLTPSALVMFRWTLQLLFKMSYVTIEVYSGYAFCPDNAHEYRL